MFWPVAVEDGILFATILILFAVVVVAFIFIHSHPEIFLAQALVYKHLDSTSQKNKLFLKGNDKECEFPTGKWIHL